MGIPCQPLWLLPFQAMTDTTFPSVLSAYMPLAPTFLQRPTHSVQRMALIILHFTFKYQFKKGY